MIDEIINSNDIMSQLKIRVDFILSWFRRGNPLTFKLANATSACLSHDSTGTKAAYPHSIELCCCCFIKQHSNVVLSTAPVSHMYHSLLYLHSKFIRAKNIIVNCLPNHTSVKTTMGFANCLPTICD